MIFWKKKCGRVEKEGTLSLNFCPPSLPPQKGDFFAKYNLILALYLVSLSVIIHQNEFHYLNVNPLKNIAKVICNNLTS